MPKGHAWGPLEDRLARYVPRGEGCWEWQGTVLPTGYGQIGLNRRKHYAHRFMYEREVGPIPAGLELDHLCGNRRCVRPSHLEAVTHAENTRRADPGGFNARKTHCPRGHEYTLANTYLYLNRRNCRACARQRGGAWREGRAA